MPSNGTLTYNGTATVRVNDTVNLYDVEMGATITADIGTSTLNVELRNVAAGGTRTSLVGQPNAAYTAGGSEVVDFSGATIAGNTFSGGTSATVSGWNGAGGANIISGNVALQSQGAFGGPQADEVGGVASVTSNNGSASFVFVGD